MKKLFVQIPTLEKFKTLKLATDESNTEYYLYGYADRAFLDTPEIKWDQICFIEDVSSIYVRKHLYADMSKAPKLSVSNDSTNLAEVTTDYALFVKTSNIEDVVITDTDNGLVIDNSNTNNGLATAENVALQITKNEKVVAAILNNLQLRLQDVENRLQTVEDITNQILS